MVQRPHEPLSTDTIITLLAMYSSSNQFMVLIVKIVIKSCYYYQGTVLVICTDCVGFI